MPHLVTAAIAILLAGEPVHFDRDLSPQFTLAQLRGTADLTRAGLMKWAATDEGRQLIMRLKDASVEILVIEDAGEPGTGRAPQPGIATLLAAYDRTKIKRYELILNPYLAAEYGRYTSRALGEPVTPVDVMAAAWAGEMLHIDFYAQGIPLPHHYRPEFQERWQRVASELGFPIMRHDTEP